MELEASRYAKNILLRSTKIFHYRQAHSENFHFFVIFGFPLPPVPPPPQRRGWSQKVMKSVHLVYISGRDLVFRLHFGGVSVTKYCK